MLLFNSISSSIDRSVASDITESMKRRVPISDTISISTSSLLIQSTVYYAHSNICILIDLKECAGVRSSVKYLCRDILANKFFHEIETIVHEQTQLHNRTCILVGMHLCGTLSERAIDIFHRTKDIAGIILSPCCLPKLHEYDKGRTAFVKGKQPHTTGTSERYNTTNSELLYNYFRWANYLAERVSGQQVIRHDTLLSNTDDTKFSGGCSDDDDDDNDGTLDNVNVRLYTDEEMHTEKNAIIVGLRSELIGKQIQMHE